MASNHIVEVLAADLIYEKRFTLCHIPGKAQNNSEKQR